jgi:quercetin 2,3-dioxygenase
VAVTEHWFSLADILEQNMNSSFPMIRRSNERGYADHGWLKSFHSFSFAGYYDPKFNGFGPLRVINEDRIAPGGGFGTHGHRDMEIISYVLEGALAHKDSMGNGSVIRPGDVQRMSAGSGILHSEFNHQKNDTTHFLQIWIEPNVTGGAPSYEEKHFTDSDKRGRLRLVGSPDGREGSVKLQQNTLMYAGLFDGDERAEIVLAPKRKLYVHLARGSLELGGQRLQAGDAIGLQNDGAQAITHKIAAGEQAEVLVFDMA